jgi:hypothetical protein
VHLSRGGINDGKYLLYYLSLVDICYIPGEAVGISLVEIRWRVKLTSGFHVIWAGRTDDQSSSCDIS